MNPAKRLIAAARGVLLCVFADTTAAGFRFNRDVSISPKACAGVSVLSSGDVRVNQGCGYVRGLAVNDISKPSLPALIETFLTSVPASLMHFDNFNRRNTE
jgi:hypothetical protein